MIKRILIGYIALSIAFDAFAQSQFVPTGGNNPSHANVGGGTGGSGTSLTAGPGIAINNGVISTNGTNSVTLSTFGYYTNIATNTIITNPNAYPYIVSINLNQIGTINTPGYAQITINSGGPGSPPQVANYNTNQVTGFLNAMIPANATWFLSFQNTGGAIISSFNAFIYGTTPGTFAAGVIATPVSIPNGGTGQTTASAGLTALGAGGTSTIITPILSSPQIQPGNGQTSATAGSPSVVFPNATGAGGDQPFMIVGAGNSSGAGPTMPMLNMDTHFPLTASGAHSFDDLAMAVISVPWGAPQTDGAGWTGIIDNSPEPIVIAHAHTGGNTPNIYTTGDVPNGNVVEIPYFDGTPSDNQVLPLIYSVGGTNYFSVATNMPKLFEVKQDTGAVNIYNPANAGSLNMLNGALVTTTAGTVLKANGKISNANAFDPTDANIVNLADASISATNYSVQGFGNNSGYWDLQGPGVCGWQMAGSGAVSFFSGSARQYWVDNTGIYPINGITGTIGKTGVNAWASLFTKGINEPQATNSPSGAFFLNGTTTVNVGNTTVTTTNVMIHFQEYGANGGTQAGLVFIVSITPNTGFAVKGVALDLSYVKYDIINNY